MSRGPTLQYPIPGGSDGAEPSENDPLIRQDSKLDGDERQSCRVSVRAKNKNELSSLGAFFSVVNSVVAGGILSIPFTFHLVGIGGGLIFLLSMGIVALYTNALLIWATDKQKCTSYPELGEKCLGWPGRVFVQLCIIFMNLGVLTGIWVTVADILPHVFVIWFNFDPDLMLVRGICILICYVVVLPFLLLREIEKMKFVSSIATFMVMAFSFTVMGVFLESYARDRISIEGVRYFKTEGTEKHWFRVLPIVCFSLTIHDVVPLVQKEILEPKATHMNLVNVAAYAFTILLYGIVGVFGYLTFQDKTRSDVVRNYGAGDYGIMDVMKLIYVLTVLASYPLEHFSLRQAVDSLVFKEKEPYTNYRFVSETLVMTVMSIILAMVFPDLSDVFAVTGTLTTFWLMFVLPSVFYIRSFPGWSVHKILAFLSVVLGLVVMLISVYIVALDIVDGGFKHLEFWKQKMDIDME